jgi:cardiolipin synthase
MPETLRSLWPDFGEASILATLYSLAGFGLAVLLIGRLMREKRAPANTFAWVLVIVLLPLVGCAALSPDRESQAGADRPPQEPPLSCPPACRARAARSPSPTAHAITAAGAPPLSPVFHSNFWPRAKTPDAVLEQHIPPSAHSHSHHDLHFGPR